jgi:hypothetical protein
VGNALTISVTSGKGAQYVDVDLTNSLKSIKSAMTVDFWIKPTREAGTNQYIAGIWGPGKDKNDSWAIYINTNDSLVFEINGKATNLGEYDNIAVKAPAASIYNKWTHIAAVFDGSRNMAYILIDGALIDSSTNAQYPITELKYPIDNLPLQIGGTNALSDSKSNRTLKGQIDEFRIWNRTFLPIEIYCNLNNSTYGDEPGLILYYRFNENQNNFTICDASNFANQGRARSGARCTASDRQIMRKFISDISAINDTLICDTIKSWSITVTDTSVCGGRVWMRVINDLASSYTITPANLTLQPNIPQIFTLTLKTNFVGDISSTLQIISYNRCGSFIQIPIKLTRLTELSYTRSSIDFDTVTAGCKDKPYIDSTIKICNNTLKFGTPRSVTINSITTAFPSTYQIISKPLPLTITPGQCEDVTIRFWRGDVTGVYNTNLVVNSDDRCNRLATIQLKGAAFEAIAITKDGKNRLDSINFGTFCLGVASPGVEYYWSNQMKTPIYVDTIIVPDQFIGKPLTFPQTLNPKWGYRSNYFRFLPTKRGVFRDSIIFRIRTDECVVERKIYVSGRGFFADLEYTDDTLKFGNVIVGQERVLNATIRNTSPDTLNVRFYLRSGEAFFLSGAKSATILPGQSANIPVTFRPPANITYYDQLCYYETKCGSSGCMTLEGNGFINYFDFNPMVMITENVIGCSSMDDTLTITNISGGIRTLSSFVFINPGGRYSLINPAALPSTLQLQDKESARFIFRYTPNDVLAEHADRAFLRFKTEDNQDWFGQLYGTSLIPKIFITAVTKFGTLEVGDTKRDTLLIENTSPFDIVVDSLTIPTGFQLVYPSISINRTLKNGDSIHVIVDFVPATPGNYNSTIKVYLSSPCSVSSGGLLQGDAIILPLEIPLSVISFGFARPCDCILRELPLVNNSIAFPMTIDSIWIDGVGVTNPHPEFFSWKSFYSPNSTLPYQIPKSSFDTVKIEFCPRTPALNNMVDNGARIHVKGSGAGWSREYATFLLGKRALVIQPKPDTLVFPPTRVDTFSTPRYDYIRIPDFAVNPDRSDITLDSIVFVPDERVFFASDSLGRAMPITIDSTKYIPLKIDFKPRAVRGYKAKMKLYFSNPCFFSDTTVYVEGSGFAPAYGLNLVYDRFRIRPDTFRLINCQTIDIPVYSTRDIPAKVIDVQCHLKYDTSKLALIKVTSPYSATECKGYPTNASFIDLNATTKIIRTKNLCNADSLKPLFIATFMSKSLNRDIIPIKVDSIKFDTEDVLLYNLIAGGDDGILVVQKPEIKLLNQIDFDSVQVLDCKVDTLVLTNNGDVPVEISGAVNLPKYTKVLASIPPFNSILNPRDTASLILEFCPRKKETVQSYANTISINPCNIADSTNIEGIGFAPPFNVITDISSNFYLPDTLRVRIGDTITVPILFNKDFSANIRGVNYWLRDLSFSVQLNYNYFALKYIEAINDISGKMSQTITDGSIILTYEDVDSVRSGIISRIKFLTTVPDSINSEMRILSSSFDSDSLLFLDIIPEGSSARLSVEGNCSLTYLKFTNVVPELSQNTPNPWSEATKISFAINEYAPLKMVFYDVTGRESYVALNGKQIYAPGIYTIDISNTELRPGLYFYVLEAGMYRAVKSTIVIGE